MINILRVPKRGFHKLRQVLFPPDAFLNSISGVIHVGANSGQEREQYASLGLNVVWVEPIPTVFEVLQSNIAAFPKQKALCRLLADRDGIECDFHVANNEGASSSILDFGRHAEIWPDVHYTHDLRMTTTTLAKLIESEKIDLSEYEALVLDTQGSELLVLKGAVPVLDRFRFIKAEVADFDSYAGCCQLTELTDFLRQYAFAISRKTRFSRSKKGGAYYDVVYKRLPHRD
jgi:FkbM family methyltransferase